jgi:hypothetical protein
MSHAELLAEYNRLSPTQRNALFKSKLEALSRINALLDTPVADTPVVEIVETNPGEFSTTTGMEDAEVVPTAPVVLTVGARDPKDVRGRGVEARIRLLTEGGANPRKENTDAHRHFEAMRGDITVREYLAMFTAEEHRTARAWLGNTRRDGFISLDAPDEPQQ